MVKSYKNDIFNVLKHLDDKDYGYYDTLTDEQKEEIQPYTLMRWMSATYNNEVHEQLNKRVNERVNRRFWELSKYKDLQWKLLCASGMKTSVRHQWIPFYKRTESDRLKEQLRDLFPSLNDEDYTKVYQDFTKEDLKGFEQYIGNADKKKR